MFNFFKRRKIITADDATKLVINARDKRLKRINKCKKFVISEIMEKIISKANTEGSYIDISHTIGFAIDYCQCTNYTNIRREIVDYVAEKMSQIGYALQIEPEDGLSKGKESFIVKWKLAEPDSQP